MLAARGETRIITTAQIRKTWKAGEFRYMQPIINLVDYEFEIQSKLRQLVSTDSFNRLNTPCVTTAFSNVWPQMPSRSKFSYIWTHPLVYYTRSIKKPTRTVTMVLRHWRKIETKWNDNYRGETCIQHDFNLTVTDSLLWGKNRSCQDIPDCESVLTCYMLFYSNQFCWFSSNLC